LKGQKLHNLHCPSYIVRVIKSKKKKWEGHVENMGDMKIRMAYKILDSNPEDKRPYERHRQ
jgi:hypothetical protein